MDLHLFVILMFGSAAPTRDLMLYVEAQCGTSMLLVVDVHELYLSEVPNLCVALTQLTHQGSLAA